MRKRLLAGKYELIEPVGKGGMASVWLGLTHGEGGFTRKVAIKRVLRHLQKDEKFENMFVEEARVVADLNHPNIVQVHDFGRDREGGYFIVMEWVEGLSVESWVHSFARLGELPPWHLACAMSIEALRALGAAHTKVDDEGGPVPVFHRDVAPANILVGVNGSVKLTDFGLARAMDRPSTTDPGTVKGKVAYMSPECLEGAKPSATSDLYAVGVVLWEALTARRLFGGTGTDVDVALRVLEGDIPDVETYRRDIPAELGDFVRVATARDPRARYNTATTMIDELSNMLRAQTQHTDGPTLGRSAREAVQRLPTATVGISISPRGTRSPLPTG